MVTETELERDWMDKRIAQLEERERRKEWAASAIWERLDREMRAGPGSEPRASRVTDRTLRQIWNVGCKLAGPQPEDA